MHLDGEKPLVSIGQDVTLATFDLLGRIEAL
jgi:hypothetical protein